MTAPSEIAYPSFRSSVRWKPRPNLRYARKSPRLCRLVGRPMALLPSEFHQIITLAPSLTTLETTKERNKGKNRFWDPRRCTLPFRLPCCQSQYLQIHSPLRETVLRERAIRLIGFHGVWRTTPLHRGAVFNLILANAIFLDICLVTFPLTPRRKTPNYPPFLLDISTLFPFTRRPPDSVAPVTLPMGRGRDRGGNRAATLKSSLWIDQSSNPSHHRRKR